MNVTVSSGKYDVISSGCVIADAWESDIQFHIHLNALTILEVELRFEYEEGKDRNFTVESTGKSLLFRCVNFSDTVGTSHPLEIGEFLGKKIFLSFRNYEEKNVMRKIDYAFYTYKQETK